MEENHMQGHGEPPAYAPSKDPHAIHLPPIEHTDLRTGSYDQSRQSISSTTSSEPNNKPMEPVEPKYTPTVWPSSNPLVAYYSNPETPSSASARRVDSPGAMDIDAGTPDSRGHRRGGSILSFDDPDVRLAAEALGDLRADFVQSPPSRHSSIPKSSGPQAEPLLSLLTTSHPLIETAIGGSLSAYSASKNYSPRFKSGAEYVERRFTPVVKTVNSVSRVTGVEGGVRWFLGGRRRGHQPQASSSSTSIIREDQGATKRRKTTTEDDAGSNRNSWTYPTYRQEFQLHHRSRAPSQSSTAESLPPYDDNRSPGYELSQALTRSDNDPANPSWQQRLILSTSGLSIAMSEESLRSLKYCLGWLRWANEHIGKVITALASLLESFEPDTSSAITSGQDIMLRSEAEREAMNRRVAELKSDVLTTLKNVVDVVSKYAGGALPENARVLVRRHLTSLPQRFKLARTSDAPAAGADSARNSFESVRGTEAETREGAKRVMVLAKEGLDMMAQVSGVLDGTIVSAEEWCERLGKKNRSGELAEDMLKQGLPREKRGFGVEGLSLEDRESGREMGY